MDALIGHTGYVGSELSKHRSFHYKFNSKNIQDIQGCDFKNLVISGLPAAKWQANQDPDKDYQNMQLLADSLKKVTAEKAILISSIDVYQSPIQVNEDDPSSPNGIDAYGRNRAIFENWMRELFENLTVVRLPGLFSKNLRKNLIFDLMNAREDQILKYNPESMFQFFNMNEIDKMLKFAVERNIPVLNAASEPVSVKEIVEIFGNYQLQGEQVINYDFQSKYAPNKKYFYSKVEVLDEIKELANEA